MLHLTIIDKRRFAAFCLTALLLACAGVWGMARAGGEEGAPAALLVAPTLPQWVPAVAGDPLQQCAAKALNGEFGVLQRWQRDAYEQILRGRVTCQGQAKVTCYGPFESPRMSGGPYAWLDNGQRVTLGPEHCAANPEIPKGSIVWTDWGLRFVVDRGGWVKLGYVRGVGRVTSAGESANFDYWSRRDLGTRRHAPYAIVRRGW